ncbi:hypothetical protein [Sedimenticola hydrogenitrophicus]|uniref:hypothetical protein n=1 Tax=Sedimenticola hydrogenitrophicus TaxID=2967975 RepID=UPI0023B03F4A|nr:hypothetical protein [Sedimenticola hydrogenitrophicus]
MKSITDLEIAVLNQDYSEVQSILADLDKHTELMAFRKAAAHFGFSLFEHHGRGYAMRRELGLIYGYMDESGLRKLCERWGTETLSLGTFGHDVRDLAIQQLGLSRNDGKTIFVGWDTFLLAGMESQTDAAKKVKAYLLHMERAGRIAGGALSVVQSRHIRLEEAEKVSKIASRIDRMKNTQFRSRVARYIDDVLDGALDVQGQLNLFSSLLPDAAEEKQEDHSS